MLSRALRISRRSTQQRLPVRSATVMETRLTNSQLFQDITFSDEEISWARLPSNLAPENAPSRGLPLEPPVVTSTPNPGERPCVSTVPPPLATFLAPSIDLGTTTSTAQGVTEGTGVVLSLGTPKEITPRAKSPFYAGRSLSFGTIDEAEILRILERPGSQELDPVVEASQTVESPQSRIPSGNHLPSSPMARPLTSQLEEIDPSTLQPVGGILLPNAISLAPSPPRFTPLKQEPVTPFFSHPIGRADPLNLVTNPSNTSTAPPTVVTNPLSNSETSFSQPKTPRRGPLRLSNPAALSSQPQTPRRALQEALLGGSGPLSSSPAWHRTETIYKRRSLPPTPENVKAWRAAVSAKAELNPQPSAPQLSHTPERPLSEPPLPTQLSPIPQLSSPKALQFSTLSVPENECIPEVPQFSTPRVPQISPPGLQAIKSSPGMPQFSPLKVQAIKSSPGVPQFSSPRVPAIKSSPRVPQFSSPGALPFSPPGITMRGLSTMATIELATQKRLAPVAEGQAPISVTRSETPKVVVPFCLSKEQQHVINLAKEGGSIFYTGSAGTGKSILLKSLIKAMRALHPDEGAVCVTASTGLAAVNIGGTTLHSFAGVGLGDGTMDQLCRKARTNRRTATRWRLCKLLIIDEISMIDGAFLDKLDYVAKGLRKLLAPFGGIQLILCGDFYQLPPVSKNPEEPTPFAFQSQTWKEAIRHTIVLQEVFRQRGDTDFVAMLNEMRTGNISARTATRFASLSRPLRTDDGLEPAELFPTRMEVERANLARLLRLPGNLVEYHARDGGLLPHAQRLKALANFLAPERLALKKHAQVMMVKNLDETLVNGSLGRVLEFVDRETYMCYRDVEEDPYRATDTLTLEKKLAFAQREAEKAGETSLEAQTYDPLDDSVFDFTKHLKRADLLESEREAIDRKHSLITEIHAASARQRLPLVRFSCSDGTTRDVLVEYEEWSMDDDMGKKLAYRRQVPLILAWSLSIHKSQGQTIPKLRVDLRRTFEMGQAYVALSRAVSRRSLQVLNFDPSKVKTHPLVIRFYETLVSAEEAMEGVKKETPPDRFEPQDPRDPTYRPAAHLTDEAKRANRLRRAKEELAKKRSGPSRSAQQPLYY